VGGRGSNRSQVSARTEGRYGRNLIARKGRIGRY
jgi:hypothetical protein